MLAAKTESLLRHLRDELRARFITRIVKLLAASDSARIGIEMDFILFGQESALMMIEPPSQSRRTAVFEIDDGVLVSVEDPFIKHLPGLMSKPFEYLFGIGIYTL